MWMHQMLEYPRIGLPPAHVWTLRGSTTAALLAMAALAAAVWVAPSPASAPRDTLDAAGLRHTVAAVLRPTQSDTSGRLIRTAVPFSGDAQVEFVARDAGSLQANRLAALTDALAIARAVYDQPGPRPLNLTLLGFAERPSAGVGRVAVLYVSAAADRLVGRDWNQIRAENLPELAGVRWLPNGLCVAWLACAAVGS